MITEEPHSYTNDTDSVYSVIAMYYKPSYNRLQQMGDHPEVTHQMERGLHGDWREEVMVINKYG